MMTTSRFMLFWLFWLGITLPALAAERVHVVQVAAIPEASAARRELGALQAGGWPEAFILVMRDQREQSWYTVHLGSRPDFAQAQALVARYQRGSGKKAQVISLDPEKFRIFQERWTALVGGGGSQVKVSPSAPRAPAVPPVKPPTAPPPVRGVVVTNAYFSDQVLQMEGFLQPNMVINALPAGIPGKVGFFLMDLALPLGPHRFQVQVLDEGGHELGRMLFPEVKAPRDRFVYTLSGAIEGNLPPGWLFFRVGEEGSQGLQPVGEYAILARQAAPAAQGDVGDDTKPPAAPGLDLPAPPFPGQP